MTGPVIVKESHYVVLSGQDAVALLRDPMLWKLVPTYLTVEQQGPEAIKLTARTFIGRADLSQGSLEIIEKVPGETAVLLGYATNGSFKVRPLSSEAGRPGVLVSLLVRQFLESVRAYASAGRIGAYARRPAVSSLVGGRIRMVDTIRLRARGMPHRVAFDRTVLAFDTPLNRAVRAALREVEDLARRFPLDEKDLASARGLAAVFGDCMDARFLATPRDSFLDDLQSVLANPWLLQVRDLGELTMAILARLSLDLPDAALRHAPRAWFINLGTLFEDACRQTLRRRVAGLATVEKGHRDQQLFSDAPANRYRADPDIIIRALDRPWLAVGDVKHKEWSREASEADVYQLLTHTATYGATDCFLIFAHTAYDVVDLGTNPLGGNTWLFAVDVQNLDAGIAEIASTLGMVPRLARTA